MKYEIVKNTDPLFKVYSDEIYRLRHKVFKQKLNWKVDTVDGDKEIDYFDSLDDLHYVLAFDDNNKLIGCMRLLPTLNDYMLEKVFPDLVDGKDMPKEDKIWEVSRVAVDPDYQRSIEMMSFDKATLLLLKGACEFSKKNNIECYVTVTTDRLGRLLQSLKMDSKRIGKKLAMEDCNVVTLQFNMNAESFGAIETALIK
jgi:acyl homoserine lactone synthase